MSTSSAYSARSCSVRWAALVLVLDRLQLVVVDGVDRRLGPITAILAVGSAMHASGSKAGPAIA